MAHPRDGTKQDEESAKDRTRMGISLRLPRTDLLVVFRSDVDVFSTHVVERLTKRDRP